MAIRNFNIEDTIFSLLTGTAFPSAVSVMRLSGKKTFNIVKEIFVPSKKFSMKRGFQFGKLLNKDKTKIDDILLLVFPKPNSYTGEDVVEFHCHGSFIIMKALTETLLFFGARFAEKGEFTYRAFLNGKMKFEDIENLSYIFKAKDTASLKAIYERSNGSVKLFFEKIRNKLIDIQAIVNTAIDFEEEYPNVISQINEPLSLIIHECSLAIQRYSEFVDSQIPTIALVGRPNVGKSSLFNALLGKKRSLVHNKPGTTRDVIEDEIEISGRRWKLADTAGIRESGSLIENEAIKIAEKYAIESNLGVLVIDSTSNFNSVDEKIMNILGDKMCAIAWNKIDLPNSKPVNLKFNNIICVSAVTGEGIDELWSKISKAVLYSSSPMINIPLPSLIQKNAIECLYKELKEIDLIKDEIVPEVISEKIRKGLAAIEDVCNISQDEILERIFEEFCIGK